MAAHRFLVHDETVEESTLDLATPCKFLVVRLNGGFVAGTLDEPCTDCALLVVAFACVGFGLEILNDFS